MPAPEPCPRCGKPNPIVPKIRDGQTYRTGMCAECNSLPDFASTLPNGYYDDLRKNLDTEALNEVMDRFPDGRDDDAKP